MRRRFTWGCALVLATSACAHGSDGGIGDTSQGGQGGTSTTNSGPGSGAGAGSGGAGSAGGPGSSSSSSASASGGSSSGGSTSSSSSSGTGGGSCSVTHLVIAEIKTRGIGGGSDEFIELFNPTASAITLDADWSLMASAQGPTANYTARWTGAGTHQVHPSIPAHGHYLVAGSAFQGSASLDDTLSSGIKDAASVLLQHTGTTVDAICFGYTGANTFGASFECEGNPADNTPHDDTTGGSSNTDASLVRKGSGCTDSGDSASDFDNAAPSTPQGSTG